MSEKKSIKQPSPLNEHGQINNKRDNDDQGNRRSSSNPGLSKDPLVFFSRKFSF
jgi:hypothetical protein